MMLLWFVIMLLWFVITLFCYTMVSFRFAISTAISLKLIFIPSRSGETETLAVKNKSSLSYVNRGAVIAVRFLNDCWASIIFALGFFKRPFDSTAG